MFHRSTGIPQKHTISIVINCKYKVVFDYIRPKYKNSQQNIDKSYEYEYEKEKRG